MQRDPSHSPSAEVSGGSVVGLWRYPVKSMMGEEVNSAEVTERGLVGDRQFAVVDAATGKVAGAKNPRKWGNFFDFRAAYDEPPQANSKLPADMEGLDHRDTVTEWELPAGTFFDLAVIHVLTTATIDRLRALYPDGRVEVRRFRPNIVVATGPDAQGFVENDWIDHTAAIGDEIRLRVTGPCPRCVMITLPQGDLPKDAGILRTAAQHNQANVGVYADVIAGGTIRRGDSVTID
jgi:uncharacterized protein YcbX